MSIAIATIPLTDSAVLAEAWLPLLIHRQYLSYPTTLAAYMQYISGSHYRTYNQAKATEIWA